MLYLGDSIVRGNWPVFALGVGPVALILWAAWIFLYRPRVSFDSQRVIVVNPGRVIEIPWQRVSGVRQRFQILLDLDDGSTVTCWGSPFPDKPGRTRPDPRAALLVGGAVIGPLEGARQRAHGRSKDVPIERRFDIVPVAVGLLLIATCVVELATAH